MQIVSNGDILREMSKCFLGKSKKNIINLSSVEFAQRVVKVKEKKKKKKKRQRVF